MIDHHRLLVASAPGDEVRRVEVEEVRHLIGGHVRGPPIAAIDLCAQSDNHGIAFEEFACLLHDQRNRLGVSRCIHHHLLNVQDALHEGKVTLL